MGLTDMGLLRLKSSTKYAAVRVRNPRARSDDLVIEEIEDEVLIYDFRNKRAHCLGATAARVWRACDGNSEVDALSEALQLDTEVVTKALDELDALELLDTDGLQVVQTGNGNGNGITRRQLTRRSVGVGTGLLAAPMVYTINVSTAWAASPIPFQCQLYSTRSCGESAGCGSIAGCCCCCNSGGSCKICSAESFCHEGGQVCPNPGEEPDCTNVGRIRPASPQGCCGVAGADNCGCGFGPQARCCEPATGNPCVPGSSGTCVPCCAGQPLTATAPLGCCTSNTTNNCD